MNEHSPRTVERHCDVAVVGGSAAGLAAALQLGRQRRSVIVIDAREPRNAPATHMHSFLGREGQPPSHLIDDGREEVRRYGGEVLDGRVERVVHTEDDRFRLELIGGHAVVARRVLAATGLIDELPDIDGLTQQWGRDVIHCPFCHGYEIRDQRIVQIVTNPVALHQAGLLRQLSARLTVVLHDGVDPDDPQVELLRASGVGVVEGRVHRVVTSQSGRLEAVELTDGDRLDADAVAIAPRFHVRAEPFASLGLRTAAHPNGLGEVVDTDARGETAIAGLYAAGNITDPSQQVLQAAADGSRVGGMISFSLADEDIAVAARPSANEADWDHRYSSDRMWSGNPNGTLVHEVTGLAPGRALDVGAGEGGDAIWLAEQGWQVTASDISQRALDRVRAEADHRRLAIEYLHTDANGLDAYEAAAFDLVSAQYASIPRTPDDRAAHNLLAAVAPGGLLLAVSHDLEPMRAPIDTRTHRRAFDPDAYVRVEDLVAVIERSPDWTIELHEKRPRPPGAASSHHVDDIVLRARRREGWHHRGMRTRWWVALPIVVAMLAGGCTSADQVSDEVIDSVPFLEGATAGNGAQLRDGIEVVPGSRLLADAFPEERRAEEGGPDLDRGWTALAVVTGDARRVLDAYAAQASKLGLPVDTVDCVEVPQADHGVTAQVTACTAVSQSADGRNVYRLDFTRSRGLPGFGPVSHVWITHRLLTDTPTYSEAPGPGGATAVADPGTGRSLPWRPLASVGQRFEPGAGGTAGFVVEEGSHLVGPPGVTAGDPRLDAPLAILRLDGDVETVVDAYRQAFRPGYETHRSSTQQGVRVDHWYWTNGDTATVDVYRRPGRPTWMQVWHTAGD